MFRSSVTTAGVLAVVLAFSASSIAAAQDGVPAEPVENPNTGEISDTLIPQADAYETYAEHIRVLNDCDWLGLMAQYPDNAEIHLQGQVFRGRHEIGALFAGFVQEFPAGNCGLTFTEESLFEVENTENVLWSADAPFIAEPHPGSDAYVTDGQYMVAQVTTFGIPALVYTEDAQAQLDALAAEAAAAAEDMADEAEKDAEDKADEAEKDAEDKADDAEDKADQKEDELEEKADQKEDELEEKADA